ncbi:lytic transglycosylase domain-containing protein [Thiocystis violacea]|uniref:lytic transglycosylase domain-containing protein n=1 Tax=Thiocystis violacea TaxID=13725 RepID=UPI001906C216|nr:transglycosylase SLT domain-containing protein [Thiocystis violacea]MBK1718211.1 hypothetical protein [Thiocystis violacea]
MAILFVATPPAATGTPPFDELPRSEDPARLLEWGKQYFHGVRAPQDIDRAIQLYCAAARLGSAEAQYRLGDIYARTLTGKTDEVLAASWLLKAAVSKYDAARTRLARWDLTEASFTPEPECVTSAAMVARTLPRARPVVAKPAQPEPKAETPVPAVGKSPNRREIERLVQALAPGFRLNPELVLAVIEVESNFNPKARSNKSAQGLMQLIPATARRFGVADPWDARQNLSGGMAYLRWLLDHFDGDLRLALAGYNAGEQAVRRHGGVPPYKETRGYVRRVARVLGVSEDGLASVETGPAGIAAPGGAGTDWERRFFSPNASG